jgi:hypothetical protein
LSGPVFLVILVKGISVIILVRNAGPFIILWVNLVEVRVIRSGPRQSIIAL